MSAGAGNQFYRDPVVTEGEITVAMVFESHFRRVLRKTSRLATLQGFRIGDKAERHAGLSRVANSFKH